MRMADRIAYVNHDIDDAIRAGILEEADLPASTLQVLGRYHSQRINTLVNDMVERSRGKDEIRLGPEVEAALDELRAFLFDRVYIGSVAKMEEGKAVTMLRSLFAFYLEHPEEMPEEFQGGEEELSVRVCDYVAGMTDRYADSKYREHFVPRSWEG